MPKQRKVLNVFISQLMHGRSEEEIMKERKEIMSLLGSCNPYKKTWDLHIINNLRHENKIWTPDWQARQERIWNLGLSISEMADADLVVLAEGFSYANGCICEYDIAMMYNIPTVQAEWEPVFISTYMIHAMRAKNKWRYKK